MRQYIRGFHLLTHKFQDDQTDRQSRHNNIQIYYIWCSNYSNFKSPTLMLYNKISFLIQKEKLLLRHYFMLRYFYLLTRESRILQNYSY